MHWMFPFLVIKDKRQIRSRPQQVGASRYLHISWARSAAFVCDRKFTHVGSPQGGRRVSKGLACVRERLAVHVLVKGRQAVKIDFLFIQLDMSEAIQNAPQNL